MKFHFSLFTLLFSLTTFASENKPLISCITYQEIQQPDFSSSYLKPRMLHFSDLEQVQSRTIDIGENRTLSLFIKMLSEDTLLVVDSEDRLAKPHPEFFMELGQYSYIGQTAPISFMEDGSEVKLTAMCFRVVNEARVPYLKQFKAMIEKKIESIDSEKFLQLVK